MTGLARTGEIEQQRPGGDRQGRGPRQQLRTVLQQPPGAAARTAAGSARPVAAGRAAEVTLPSLTGAAASVIRTATGSSGGSAAERRPARGSAIPYRPAGVRGAPAARRRVPGRGHALLWMAVPAAARRRSAALRRDGPRHDWDEDSAAVLRRAVRRRRLAVLTFDYRQFGASDGEPRQLVHVDRQLEEPEDGRQLRACAAGGGHRPSGVVGHVVGCGPCPVGGGRGCRDHGRGRATAVHGRRPRTRAPGPPR